MPSRRRNNLIPTITLILTHITSISALTLPKREDDDDDSSDPKTIHLSPGISAAIAIGVLVIVALSIFFCCPCWKWTSHPHKKFKLRRRRSSSPSPRESKELDRRHEMMRGHVEGVERERDAPPGYEEVGYGGGNNGVGMGARQEIDSKEIPTPRNAVLSMTMGRQELDSRDTMVRPQSEMLASTGRNREGGGTGTGTGTGTGEWVVSPVSAVEVQAGGGNRFGHGTAGM